MTEGGGGTQGGSGYIGATLVPWLGVRTGVEGMNHPQILPFTWLTWLLPS